MTKAKHRQRKTLKDREGGDRIKFIDLRFERGHIVECMCMYSGHVFIVCYVGKGFCGLNQSTKKVEKERLKGGGY